MQSQQTSCRANETSGKRPLQPKSAECNLMQLNRIACALFPFPLDARVGKNVRLVELRI